MLNPATEKLVINNYLASYTMLYAQHNFYLDDDVVSKVAFYKTGSLEKTAFFSATEKLYTFFTLKELTSNSLYTLNAAFYDQMASDVTLVNAKIGINISDTLNFSTAKTPSFTGIEVVATSVDVGVADPTVVFSLDGDGQTVVIQAQKAGSTDWLTIFDGSFSRKISVIVPVGDYKFRVAGRIMLPDGISLDVSPWNQYPLTISVSYLAVPPTTPTNLVFKAAKIKDGVERYDVQVSWTWERLQGAQVKEFMLQYVTSEEYARTGWTKASVINNASAKAIIITNFPFDKQYTFRVGVTSWGQTTVWSTNTSYIINKNTVFDQSITTVSGCEIGYYGIRGYVSEAGTYKQSFLLDAATGAVAIGTLDNKGKAPFVFDPANKILNVDGKVITNDINAANFILTNTGTGSQPKLYSQEKPTYANANSGVFIGRNGNGQMQFDVGNSASYLRFDGSSVKMSGQVVISTPTGDMPISEAIQGKNVVFIYKTATTIPATPTGSSYPPSGWSKVPTTAPCWIVQGQLDPATNLLLSGTSWSAPTKLSGDSGSDAKVLTLSTTGQIFKANQDNTITTPSSIVITGNLQNLSGNITWSSSPAITLTTTATTCTVTSGNFGTNNSVTITGSITVDSVTYSDKITINRVVDGSNAISAVLTNEAITLQANSSGVVSDYSGAVCTAKVYRGSVDDSDNWAISKYNSVGVLSTISGKTITVTSLTANSATITVTLTRSGFSTITKVITITKSIAGAPGPTGSRGSGMYAYAISGFSAWADSYATTFFNNNFGTGPTKYDVLTQYNTTNPTIADTKMWNGSAWTIPALVVHGDAIVDGTVRAQALVADSAFFANAGINIIYDKTAALSSTPESTYKMKIDLAQGFLHIR